MNFTDPSTLCLFVLVAVVILLAIRTRAQLSQQRRRSSQQERAGGDAVGPKSWTARINHAATDDLAQWEVHMHETARDLSAQLDAKLSLLQALIAEADRAARRLEAALDLADLAQPPDARVEPMQPVVASRPETFAAIQDSGAELDRMAAEPPVASERSRRREEIFQLADYGFAAAEIAHRVGSPVGEVELILGLRGK
jgi:hypothetical protein